MNIHKNGHNVIIKHKGMIFDFKPTLVNWNVADLHLLSISDKVGMQFLYTQNSPHEIHNTVMLQGNNVLLDDIVTWIMEIQNIIREKMRFSKSNTLEYAHNLVGKVNI